MPSIYVHNYFGNDVYKKIQKLNVVTPDDKFYLLLFSQSFDYLFSYNFFTLAKGKKIRKLGKYAHTHKTWEYFKNIVEYMKENKLYDDSNIGYLYGSLCHYVLDSTFHPYVHYISGRYQKKDRKATKKYMGNHTINEIMLDSIFYYKDHPDQKYYKYKLYNDKNFYRNVTFNKSLLKNMDHAYKNTFKVDDMGYIYNKAYLQCHKIYKYLMYDRFNVKKIVYRTVDFVSPFKGFKAYTYSHHINKPNLSILNSNNEIWLHPVTGEKHTESVEDLYNISIKKVISYIKICNKYFRDECTINDVKKVIKNISYSTGLDVEDRSAFVYFKY